MSKSNKPGLNLADLAPMSIDVPIGDNFLTIYGISAEDGLYVFQRFPNIAGMVENGFSLSLFLSAAPEAVAAIIAVAAQSKGDEKAEKNAARLPIETQLDILEAIGRLTFTKGFAPFGKRILALADAANSANSSKAPTMMSQPA